MARKNLKDESLNSAGSTTPPPLSKYETQHGPGKGAAATEVPRDDGGLSDGTTGGNNSSVAQMSKLPNNAGPRGTTP
jgi:hypothetical protein